MLSEFYLIAHNIRSAYNVGSFFRTADGLGVKKIFLTGYSPCPAFPDEKYPKKSSRQISKTALGADNFVEWEKRSEVVPLLEELKSQGVKIIALEQTKESVDLKKFQVDFPAALLVGNEVEGLDGETLKNCDEAVEIPMCGKKESFNVAVAAGMAMYAIMNKTLKEKL